MSSYNKLQTEIESILSTKSDLVSTLDLLIQFIKTADPELLTPERFIGQEEEVNNWKIGLGSDLTRDKAKLMATVGIIRKFLKKATDSDSILNTASLDYMEKTLLEPCKDLTRFMDLCSIKESMTTLVYRSQEDAEAMKKIESIAIKVIEPLLRNITNYMNVKEYLYRINIALEYLKNLENDVSIKDKIQCYSLKLKLLANANLESDTIEFKPEDMKDWKKVGEELVCSQSYLIHCMKAKEITPEELENITIFRCIFNIVNNFNIVYDIYKRFLQSVTDLKAGDYEGIQTGLKIITLHTSIYLQDAIAKDEELMNTLFSEQFMSKLEHLKSLFTLLFNFDVNHYVEVHDETHKAYMIGSSLFTISNLLENITKRV